MNRGMMVKKYFLVVLLLCTLFLIAPDAQAEVRWDGAVIAKGQVGKMTFSKDVKVYKKEQDGSFTSLTVKAGNFFRVYYVEQSTVGTVYGMSNGYRVQATDLVIYKAVPLHVQSMFGFTIKEQVVKLTEQNVQQKNYVVSDIPNKVALQRLNQALQNIVLEQSEIELSYSNTKESVHTFYEYEILTNEANRLAIFLQRSYCQEPCTDFTYETAVKMFDIATGEEITFAQVVKDPTHRKQIEQLVSTELKTKVDIEQLPFYETNDTLHFLYNDNGRIKTVDVSKGIYALPLLPHH